MTGTELYDDVMSHLEGFDDAFADRVAEDINQLTHEGFLEFLSHFEGEKWREVPADKKAAFGQLNQALAKRKPFNDALSRFHDRRAAENVAHEKSADVNAPNAAAHSRDASGRYNQLLAKIANPAHLQFIGDMNRAGLEVNLLTVHGDQDVIPAVELVEATTEATVRAATSVALICSDDYIHPEWMPGETFK